jgi:hypothetical protein
LFEGGMTDTLLQLMRRLTDWSITRKIQVVFLLAGTVVPLAFMLLTVLPASGPDWEGAFWPVGLVGALLLAPGSTLCKALGTGEPGSLIVFFTNGITFFLVGTLVGSLESAKRKRCAK